MNRLVAALRFIGMIISDVVRGAVRTTRDALTPGTSQTPMIVEVQLRSQSPLELTLISAAVGISGDLVLGIATSNSDDRPTSMFVHALDHTHRDQVREGVWQLENVLLRALGRDGVDGREPFDPNWFEVQREERP